MGNDSDKARKLSEEELKQVKGGPAYHKIGDINTGSVSKDKDHDKWIDILSISRRR